MQVEVINRTNPAEAKAWKAAATTIHKSSADGAEGAGHLVACANSFAGTIRSELILATNVYQRGDFDSKLRPMLVCGQWMQD